MAHSLLYCLSLEQMAVVGAQCLCPKWKRQTLALLSAGTSYSFSSPDFPSTGPRKETSGLGLGLGNPLLVLGQGGQNPREFQNNAGGLEDLPQAYALRFSFSFFIAENQFSHNAVLLPRGSCREGPPPRAADFWGRENSPAAKPSLGCGRGTTWSREQVGEEERGTRRESGKACEEKGGACARPRLPRSHTAPP